MKQEKVPPVLCPFYERECPLGEDAARACWRRVNIDDPLVMDYDEEWVDCQIADWMFAAGPPRFR